MMAGPGAREDAGGGPARHIPVLLDEVLNALRIKPGAVIVDGTFGAGGYSAALLEAGANVIAIDRDPDAIKAGRELSTASGGKLRLVEGRFSDLDRIAAEAVDGVVLDIGVSSMQLDQAERGFSFRRDGPLDMRMEKAGPSAAEIVNTLKAADLARIFGILGEERHAGRIARMIEKRRAHRPFMRTLDLADAIEALVGRHPRDKIHPATRAFQGLRIFVNDELGELAKALFAAERALRPGGRLAVVTFHSLEDRIVKRFLSDRAGGGGGSRHLPEAAPKPELFEKPDRMVAASDHEAARNPRARSAKLRAATRTATPPGAEDHSIFGLPSLPAVARGQERN
ncbi:16S rRNA (cytosine(1402)-N(4))-methyltransferase RsmH [Nitratireductor mangrovi]|uniref:Ribosomal RNA small subunit methyltransferase H n=1 Tax=Nitratireductor mangrovi TaxID=2599600 RepID=A0A5B8KUN8_9HYPH|nr:16S rRNA (cytosine(1402)-N(4))-methyltransferase RsmH [Nitratireductor mangrovi]QDY99314.1 16S rRNA (cytosine(1402)-N(4))-methyltransferase RsmH [Nitratireductor mangrovi]